MRKALLALSVLAGVLLLVIPAHADTLWTLNNVVTTSGGTISGTFDVPFYTDPTNLSNFTVPLMNWNVTYTPNAQAAFPINGGVAMQFSPSTVPTILGTPLPTNYTANYAPGNLQFPPPDVTSFVILNSSNVAPSVASQFQGGTIELFFPIAFLPNLGPASGSVDQIICTTKNANPSDPSYVGACDGNTGIGPSNFSMTGTIGNSGLGESVDPGSITGAYIPGTPFSGGGGGGTNVPEPGTLPMLGIGLAGLVGLTMWKKGALANLAS